MWNVKEMSDWKLMEAYEKSSRPDLLQQFGEQASYQQVELEYCKELMERYRINNEASWPNIYAPWFTGEESCAAIVKSNEGAMAINNWKKQNPSIEPNDFKAKIKDLETKLRNTEDPEEIQTIQQQMQAYGWNPEIPFNQVTQENAKRRILDHYTEILRPFYFINAIDNAKGWLIDSHYKTETNASETPVNIICGENSYITTTGDIKPSTLDLLKGYGINESVDIYTFFMEMKWDGQIIQTRCPWEYPLVQFRTPSNVLAAKVIKEYCDYNEINLTQQTPVIKLVYRGEPTTEAFDMVNSFNYTTLLLDQPLGESVIKGCYNVPSHAYFAVNCIRQNRN